jgi:phosphohistidine phosphatase
MSKVLYLLRHAKAMEASSGEKDYTRELDQNGNFQAARMGRRLAEKGVKPDLILSSTATRAFETARLIAEQIDYDTQLIQTNEDIYEASARTLFGIVTGLDNALNEVMLVGHNPTFSHMAEYLTGNEVGSLPTCAIAKLTFAIDDWAEVSAGIGSVEWMERPDKE